MILDTLSESYKVLLKTVYAEARGEPTLGQKAVAWVIYNRTKKDRDYWGGYTLAGVCKHPNQFECWNGKDDIIMTETDAQKSIESWLPTFFLETDPTGGCTYYNNPDKEGYPDWTTRVIKAIKIGNHQFYKDP